MHSPEGLLRRERMRVRAIRHLELGRLYVVE